MFFEVSVNLVNKKPSITDIYPSRASTPGERDRNSDAWLPMEKTRRVFFLTNTPDPDMLTMPGVLLEEDIEDEMGEPIIVCCKEAKAGCKRGSLTAGLSPNEKRLRELIQVGAYGAAINHTAALLALYGQGRGKQGHRTTHSPQSLQIWFTRIALLVKIKSFAVAQAEAQPFSQLEKPDIFYQYYPDLYGNRTGSMASFNFRLLLAELPMICGKPKDSLRKLFCIWATIKRMLKNLKQGLCEDGTSSELLSDIDKDNSLKLWTTRESKVMYSIVNCACKMKDYALAIEMLGHLCGRDGAPKHILLSALGRLHLQTGNISAAEVCFNESSVCGSNSVRGLVDKGLLAIAQQNYEEACFCFQQANILDPSNIMILNNMSVSLFHGGQTKEAISVLEAAISSKPVGSIHESLILNLCTLYDMQSSRGIMKKFALLRQMSKYSADAPTTILEKLYG